MPTPTAPKKRRVNGFERPLDVHQVVSWVAFALLLAAFFGLHTPVRTAPLGIALTVIYTVLAGTVVASAAKCMRVDPRDEGAAPGCPTQRWCSYCAKQVNERSKHCRRCNKCVEVFDHHCPWLNTCIGRHNYAYFLVLLCSVFALLSVQIASGLQVDAPAAVPRARPAHSTGPHLPPSRPACAGLRRVAAGRGGDGISAAGGPWRAIPPRIRHPQRRELPALPRRVARGAAAAPLPCGPDQPWDDHVRVHRGAGARGVGQEGGGGRGVGREGAACEGRRQPTACANPSPERTT